jgi:hypothetical protein
MKYPPSSLLLPYHTHGSSSFPPHIMRTHIILTIMTIHTHQHMYIQTLFIPLSATDASHCRDGLARFLYDAVFEHLVSAMNATILDLDNTDDDVDDVVVDEDEEEEEEEDSVSEYESEYESDEGLICAESGLVRFKHDVAEQVCIHVFICRLTVML